MAINTVYSLLCLDALVLCLEIALAFVRESTELFTCGRKKQGGIMLPNFFVGIFSYTVLRA